MDDINKELQKIIDVVNESNVDESSVSLKDLYESRKSMLNLSDRKIQKILGMDFKTLNPIINGTAKQVNFINIVKLTHFLGIPVDKLAKICVNDMNASQIGEIQRAREAGYIYENFDVQALMKMNFFNKDSSSEVLSQKIQKFFNFENLYSYTGDSLFSVFSRTKRDSNALMRNFWVRSALEQFKLINNPNQYDRKRLLELIPRIRPFTRDVKNGLVKVVKALFDVGVTVLYQPGIEKIQVRGATMEVNGNPCIVLSDLNKIYPTLWFALMHELHHVLYDFDAIKSQTFHLSCDEREVFLMDEEGADKFATDFLLNESRLKYASAYITSNYNIEKLAQKWGVHSSIIYALYCYKTDEWGHYRKYIPKMDDALELLNTSPFDKETLLESVKQLKQLIYN